MVKDGYKITDIGVIPNEWEYITINDLIEREILEKPLDGNHGEIHPTSSDFVESGIPFIMANNLGDNKINLKTCKFITKKQADKLQKGFSIENDVLLSHKGTIGEVAIVPKLFTEYIMLTPQVTYYRVKNKKKLFNKYIKHYFTFSEFQKLINNISGGGTRAYIGITKQRDLPFILPNIEEQKVIAKALSDTDELIDSLQSLIEKKENIKIGIMQQLLTGKKRLKGFSKDWDEKSLGDIANISRGASPRPIEDPRWFNQNSDIGWVRISDISKTKKYLYETVQSLSSDGVSQSRFVKSNNLIMSICATIGKPIITRKDVCIHDGFVVFNSLKIEQEFLYYFLTFIENDWAKSGQTGSQMNLNTDLINSTKIKLPKEQEEQKVIATILSDMDKEIETLKQKLKKTKAIKEAMMDELLTGKTRLL